MKLNHHEIKIIQQALELLSDKCIEDIDIYQEAYDAIISDIPEDVTNDMENAINDLKQLARSCDDISMKISNLY